MFVVDPPPPHLLIDDDRDNEAFAALCPHFESVAEVAIRAGWHPAEVLAAMVNWALDQTTEGAGVETTLEILDEARQCLVLGHGA
jgi:hypothetical protein